MNDLTRYYINNQNANGPLIQKPTHFLLIYDELLSRFRDKDIILIEIGGGSGGSTKMWKNYLGPKAKIFVADIIDHSFLNDEQITYINADQGRHDFTPTIVKHAPKIDIVIDDGSHICSHQLNSLNLFFNLKPEGLYICEDIHTSYRINYGGGYKQPYTFVEYCKDLIDALHVSEAHYIPASALTTQISSISIYRGMMVIRKTGEGDPNV